MMTSSLLMRAEVKTIFFAFFATMQHYLVTLWYAEWYIKSDATICNNNCNNLQQKL